MQTIGNVPLRGALVVAIAGLLPFVVMSVPPLLSISERFYDVAAGSNFSVVCTGNSEVTWIHVMGLDEREVGGRPLSSSSPSASVRKFASVFELDNVRYWETGRIICHYKNSSVSNETSAWMYLYVNDPEHLLANWTGEDIPTVELRTWGDEGNIIPCRPTARNVSVVLLRSGASPEEPVADARFDPMRGFSISSGSGSGVGLPGGLGVPVLYTCRATLGSTVQTMGVIAKFLVDAPLPPPQISPGPSQGIWYVLGKEMQLRCSVTVESSVHVNFQWSPPPYSSALNENRWTTVEDVDAEKGEHYSILTVRRLKAVDAGVYKCSVGNAANATYTVTVHDGSPVIETFRAEPWNISERVGEDVQWVVDVRAYPPPLHMNLTRLPHSASAQDPVLKLKYDVVDNSLYDGTVVVRLMKIAIKDFGRYYFNLAVGSGNLRKSIELGLTVQDIPRLTVTRDGQKDEALWRFVTERSKIPITCEATGYPLPTIRWGFRSCDAAPSERCDQQNTLFVMENRTNREQIHEDPLSDFRVASTLTATALVSGEYVCSAENPENYREVTEKWVPFFITDIGGEDGFGVARHSPRGKGSQWEWIPVTGRLDAVEHDSITLKCGASKFNYTNSVYWSHKRSTGGFLPGLPSGWHEIPADTDLSWGRKITAQSLAVEQSGELKCSATNSVTHGQNWFSFTLDVAAVKTPEFLEGTNMLGASQRKKPLVVKNGEIFSLNCSVSGVPKPNVTWYKDGEAFQPTDERVLINDSVLTFQPAIVGEHDGRWECRAWNKGGSDQLEAVVEVDAIVKTFGGLGDTGFALLIAALVFVGALLVCLCVYARKLRQDKAKLSKLLTEKEERQFRDGNQSQLNPNLPVSDQVEFLPYFGERWEFPRSRLELGDFVGRGAYGCVLKGVCRGLYEQNDVVPVAVKKLLPNAEKCHYLALLKEIKILSHLGRNLNVVNLHGACTLNMRKGEVLMIVEYCPHGSLDRYLKKHRKTFQDLFSSVSGLPVADEFAANSSTLTRSSGSIGSASVTRGMPYVAIGMNPGGDSGQINPNTPRRMTSASTISGPVRTAATAMTDLDVDREGRGISPWAEVYEGEDAVSGTGSRVNNNARVLCTHDLLNWAYQLASGMEYLTRRKVVHRDLAARNVLLAENDVVKICDFGLARDVYQGIYRQSTDDPVPYKWMPLESLLGEHESTSATDVWAYGVTLWELFSLARVPYANMNSNQVIEHLRAGNRLERPRYADDRVYNLMFSCWEAVPEKRPSFASLRASFEPLVDQQTKAKLTVMAERLEGKNRELFAEVGDFLGGFGVGPASPDRQSLQQQMLLLRSGSASVGGGGKPRPVMEDDNGYLVPNPSQRSSGYVAMGGGPGGDAVSFWRDSAHGPPPSFYENTTVPRDSMSAGAPAVTNPFYVNQREPVRPMNSQGQRYVNQLEFQFPALARIQEKPATAPRAEQEEDDGNGDGESGNNGPGNGVHEGDPLLLKNNPGYARTAVDVESTDL